MASRSAASRSAPRARAAAPAPAPAARAHRAAAAGSSPPAHPAARRRPAAAGPAAGPPAPAGGRPDPPAAPAEAPAASGLVSGGRLPLLSDGAGRLSGDFRPGPIQLRIAAAGCNQLVVRAALHDAPVLEHSDAVRVPDGREAMRDHDRGPAVQKPLQPGFDDPLGPHVDI